jgi:aminomethyltransferase
MAAGTFREDMSLKRTPLYECHVEAGARLVDFAGWEMPVQYQGVNQGVIEEHRAVRTAAGMFDVSHMGEVRVQGPEAEAFLQRLTPNDVSKLAPGRAHYSGLLTDSGTYVDDLLIYRLGAEEFLVVVNASNADRDFEWIASRAGTGVRVTNESDQWALLAVQGPKAVEILRPLMTPGAVDLKYYGFLQGEVDGRPAILSRTGYTGEDGFELYLRPEDAPAVWRRLLEAGVSPAGLGARDTLRLEASMALYGHEIDETTTPFEAGLAWVVKMNKGDFLGREALAAQQAEGIRRKLVGFEIQGRGIARQGHEMKKEGSTVGAVTSGTWSPSFEKAVGMAYVPAGLAAPGTALEIDVRGRALPAVVVEMPFYRRPKVV